MEVVILSQNTQRVLRRLVNGYLRLKVRLAARAFEKKPYLEAYSRRTDALTELDEKMAIGDLWEEMGQRQFDFLRAEGLLSHHRLLDIGCGTLRGGRHFIAYLEPGRYTGFDISQGAIQKAKALVEREGLADKRPVLEVNETKDLKFTDYQGKTFDFILAQSVFSHLMEEHIDEAFRHVANVMHLGSKFFFTFHIGDRFERRSNTDFQYPMRFFEELACRYGFALTDRSADYDHPRGQAMVCLTRQQR